MSPHVALRLAVRPLRSAIVPFDQFTSTVILATRFGPSLSRRHSTIRGSKLSPSICLQCTIQARSRSFSAIPPSKPSTTDTTESAQQSQSSPPQDDTTAPIDEAPHPAEPKPETEAEPESKSATSSNVEPELPSSSEHNRHPLSVRFSTFMDDLQTRFLNATQTINDLTGYSAIEAIKAKNNTLESDLAAAQVRLRTARQDYKSLTSHRAATQREVTTLLARKDTWNPSDLERFTTLYRLDHELESQVASASVELTEAESNESKLSADLNAGILKRYHEEQIWSDRIRRQSTWGTWGLMGVNILLFLVLQFVAEPWRRKRLMKHIAASEKLVMDDVKRELAEVKAALESSGLREQEKRADKEAASSASASAAAAAATEAHPAVDATTEPVDAVIPPHIVEEVLTEKNDEPSIPWQERWKTTLSDPELIKAAVMDLYSERRVELRMRDASLIALEGATAGAALVLGVALILLRGGSS